jgi:hypothetical protein
VKRYVVTRREVWAQGVQIEAEDKEDAIRRVAEGEGDDIESLFEYSHTLDRDTWDIEDWKGDE